VIRIIATLTLVPAKQSSYTPSYSITNPGILNFSLADALNLMNLLILFSVMSTAPLLCIHGRAEDATTKTKKPLFSGFDNCDNVGVDALVNSIHLWFQVCGEF